MICRAKGCFNEAMPISLENPKELCGVCHEEDEDQHVRLKSGPRKVTPENTAKRNATRKINRDAKAERYAKLVAGCIR